MKEKLKKVYTKISPRTLLIAILLVVCVLEIQSIGNTLNDLRGEKEKYAPAESWRLAFGLDRLRPEEIEPWMTFAYINTVFKLPKNYIQDALHIADMQYPNISISRYVRRNHLNGTTFIIELRQTVESYMK